MLRGVRLFLRQKRRRLIGKDFSRGGAPDFLLRKRSVLSRVGLSEKRARRATGRQSAHQNMYPQNLRLALAPFRVRFTYSGSLL